LTFFFQIEGEAKGVEELTCFVDGHAVSQRILTNKEKVSDEFLKL
jgi:hypothetical protein